MTVYKENILDAITGKETKINFSDVELKEFKANVAQQELLAKQLQADLELKAQKTTQAEAKLLALGLTTEDLKAILG